VAPKPISRQFPTLWQELGMHCLSAQLSFPFGFSAQCCCSLCVNSLAQVRATFHRLPRVTSTSSDTPPQITHDPTTSPPIYNPSLEDATQISHLFLPSFFLYFFHLAENIFSLLCSAQLATVGGFYSIRFALDSFVCPEGNNQSS